MLPLRRYILVLAFVFLAPVICAGWPAGWYLNSSGELVPYYNINLGSKSIVGNITNADSLGHVVATNYFRSDRRDTAYAVYVQGSHFKWMNANDSIELIFNGAYIPEVSGETWITFKSDWMTIEASSEKPDGWLNLNNVLALYPDGRAEPGSGTTTLGSSGVRWCAGWIDTLKNKKAIIVGTTGDSLILGTTADQPKIIFSVNGTRDSLYYGSGTLSTPRNIAIGDSLLIGNTKIDSTSGVLSTDTAKAKGLSVGSGGMVTKIVKVGSHLAIILGTDTLWAASDTTGF